MDTRKVDLGLDSKYKGMIDAVFGQMSDGSADHLAKGYRVVAQGDSVKFVKDPSI